MCGCVKAAQPKAGRGPRREAMAGWADTVRMSRRASKAETELPTTMARYAPMLVEGSVSGGD